MRKQVIALAIGILVGAGAFGAGQAVAEGAKPRPSAYCKKADLGKKVWYTTPTGKSRYQLECRVYKIQKWQRATK